MKDAGLEKVDRKLLSAQWVAFSNGGITNCSLLRPKALPVVAAFAETRRAGYAQSRSLAQLAVEKLLPLHVASIEFLTDTVFADPDTDTEGRLLSPVYIGILNKPGSFGFRGEIALKFQVSLADEKRTPEIKFDQVMAVADAGSTALTFLAGVAPSLEHLKLLCEVIGEKLSPAGKYFFFASNLHISQRFRSFMAAQPSGYCR